MTLISTPINTIWSASGSLHHAMLAADIVGFGRHQPAVHSYLRAALYRIITASLVGVGVSLRRCHFEDRGDAILVIAPTDVSVEPLLGHWPHHLRAALRHHNHISAVTAQLRLRVAINAGYVHADCYGVSGRAVLHMYRLLDAPAFKAAIDHARTDLAVITSDYLYQEVVRDGVGLIDPEIFTAIDVSSKETWSRGWICLPTPPRQPLPAQQRLSSGHRMPRLPAAPGP